MINMNDSNSINFSGDVKDVQIQQGTVNSAQEKSQERFNYEEVKSALEKISNYKSTFQSEFGDKANAMIEALDNAVEVVKRKDKPSAVRKVLGVLKDIALGTGENLIAAGIVALLTQLGI